MVFRMNGYFSNKPLRKPQLGRARRVWDRGHVFSPFVMSVSNRVGRNDHPVSKAPTDFLSK